MTEWFTLKEIAAAAAPDLPGSERSLYRHVVRAGWHHNPLMCRVRAGKGGGQEFHVSLLPQPVRLRLTQAARPTVSGACGPAAKPDREALWTAYEAAPAAHKAKAQARLNALVEVDEMIAAYGLAATVAAGQVAARHAISRAALLNWRAICLDNDRADWLAALLPQWRGPAARADCHPEIYRLIKSDYLRAERPSFTACYRRAAKAAVAKGWAPMPSERALRRHLDTDIDPATQKLARYGRDAAKAMFPVQTRSVANLHAMAAVNMDGHKLDVFVSVPGQDKPSRVFLVAIQDIFSRKFLAWRLATSENRETTRLVIGDMVERYGIPDAIYLDNGRAFASKWITGGTATRYRFKVRAEEPQGLLTSLGVAIHWTTPYSGQSKPIERAFRDIAEAVAKHPSLAGAWTGNRPDNQPDNRGEKAYPMEVLRPLVDAAIAEHNARQGRRTETADGGSFDQAFENSLASPSTIVRWPSRAQASLWLMAAEQIRTAKPSGEIRFFENRYWSPALASHAGKQVTVRFDPDNLHLPLKVYDSRDQFICEAACMITAGFADATAARETAAKRGAYLKTLSEKKRLEAELSVDQMARIYAETAPAPTAPPSGKPRVTRLATAARAAVAQGHDPSEQEDFSRGLRLVSIAGGKP